MATTVTATEYSSYARLPQVADASTTPDYKWFALTNNKLDGSFHLLDAAGTMQVGWWGTSLSDATGAFSTAPVLTVTFTATTVNGIQLCGDALLNEYPVDFSIQFYDGANALLKTINVTGNNQVAWSQFIQPSLTSVAKIVFTITRINKVSSTVKVTEATYAIITVLTRTDMITPKITEYTGITVKASSTDTVVVMDSIDTDNLIADLYRPDTLPLITTEVSNVNNIYTVSKGDVRQIYGKVEITYTDPFQDETLVVTASEVGSGTDPYQLADSVQDSAFKWFSLHGNNLSGDYHLLDSSGAYSTGWWSSQLANASGIFASPPVVTISFADRTITTLKVVGDDKLNCYPVDFTVHLYDKNGTLLYTKSVTGNNAVIWSFVLTAPVYLVAKMDLSISKINTPNSVAKITELFTAIKEEYDWQQIETMHLLEEVGYTTGSLPIGNISSNELDVTLSNFDRRFDLQNTQSPLYGYVKRNRRVRAWLGAKIVDDIEWYPLGVFWTTNWDIPRQTLSASLVARDRLEMLRQTDFTNSVVYTNKTLYDLFVIVLQDAGLLADEYDLDSDLALVTVPYAWFGKMTHRDALARIAGCAIIQVYCTREGKVRVNIDLDATPYVIDTFDDNSNIFSDKYPLAVTQQVNYIEVSSAQWSVGASENVLNYTEALNIGAPGTLTKTFEFNSTPVVSMSAPVISATAGVSVSSYTLHSWGVDITFNGTGTVNSVSVMGQVLKQGTAQTVVSKDDALIKDDGKIKDTVQHDFIQSSAYAQQLADNILTTYKKARNDVTLDNRGSVALRLGDRIMVNDTQEYTVTRQNITWAGYLAAVTEGKKL